MATAAVIGGGIGGLATAALLGARGWDVRVLERAPALPGTGTALGMWPEALAVLDAIGAGDRVRGIGHPQERAEIRSATGRRLGPPIRAGGAAVLISRPRLLEALAAQVPAIDFGSRVTDPDVPGADVVIGADGINSIARAHVVGRAVAPRPLGVDVLIGRRPGRTETFTEYWGPGRLFGVTPRDGDFINWYAEFDPRRTGPRGADPVAFLRREYAGWAPRVRETIEGIDAASVIHYHARDLPRLPRITRGTVALIGDAAHAMAPNLGRGACETLLDAATLARALGDADTATAESIAAALAEYQRRRMRAGQRIMLASRAMRATALTRWGRAPRDLVGRAAAAIA